MDELKKRPCFGQNANLGSLYSFQNEHLYPDISVFERKLPDEFQAENKITDSDGKKVAITFENTTSKKFSLLNIETDVKVSVLCGMVTSNEMNFMKHKELENRRTCFYSHTLETSYQSFDVNDKNLQNLCKKTIESEKADHVIVGITYGNQIIVKLTFDNSAKEMDDKELQEKVGKDFDNLLQLNDIGGIENYDQWFTYLPNLKFEVYPDLLFENAELKTVENFCNTFQQIKTDSKKAENVKQLYFHLMPISTFQEKTGCKFSETPIFNSITEKTMSKNIEPAFDRFDNAICQLYALKNDLENFRCYTTLAEIDSLNEHITNFEAENTKFKCNLANEVIEYRSNEDSEEIEIIVLCRNFDKKCEIKKQEILKEFEIVKQRVNYLNQIAKLGLTIVRDLHEFEYIKTEKKEIYLLSFAFSQFNQSSELEENYSYFCSLYHAKNFVFIFTKAAQSGYQAGDTIDYIEKLLNEIKAKRPGQKFDINAKGLAFNFDNMGYRYLCALQENRTLKIDQEPKYEESYRRARDETIRLLQHIKTTKPHNAADSVSIFRARNLTFRLTKPLIKIGQTQKESIIKRQRRQREIQKAANDLEKLRKILATKAPTIHWSIVKQTVDVCANCATIKEYRGNERNQFLECIPYACDIDPFLLQQCYRLEKSADGKFRCKNCGPSYIYHQIHEYLLRREEYDTKDIETSIAKKLTTKEEIEQQIKQEAQELLEIEEEIAIVINSTAKFYAYLKEESVISHNDAADTYIDVLIKCEENGRCDSDKLQSLNDLKIMLQKEKERLDEVSPITQEKLYRVTPEDVLDLVTKLEDLKHYGPDVKRAMEEKIEKRDAITEEPYISYLNQYSHNKNKIKPRIEELEKQ